MMSEDHTARHDAIESAANPATAEAGQDGLHQVYYAQARSWAEDRQAAADRSRRLAWGIATLGLAIAGLEALALMALAPLKTVVPYTLLVDRNTGFVEALDPAHPLPIKPQAALTQSLLAQYVVARETFDIDSLPDQYQKVALWSADAARRDYLNTMTRDNPDNPIGRFPRGSLVRTQVESVSSLGTNTALVRFYTEQREGLQGAGQGAGQGSGQRAFWAAVVRFRYSGEPMALAERLVNPLGFQVVQYRRDQESPPPEPLLRAPAPPPPLAMPPISARSEGAPASAVVADPAISNTAMPAGVRRATRRFARPAPGPAVETL